MDLKERILQRLEHYIFTISIKVPFCLEESSIREGKVEEIEASDGRLALHRLHSVLSTSVVIWHPSQVYLSSGSPVATPADLIQLPGSPTHA